MDIIVIKREGARIGEKGEDCLRLSVGGYGVCEDEEERVVLGGLAWVCLCDVEGGNVSFGWGEGDMFCVFFFFFLRGWGCGKWLV